MNEIIKALFIQAGGGVEEENGNLWTYSDDLDPEKFALSVVRECANIADTAEPYKAYDLIKKHFGVEE